MGAPAASSIALPSENRLYLIDSITIFILTSSSAYYPIIPASGILFNPQRHGFMRPLRFDFAPSATRKLKADAGIREYHAGGFSTGGYLHHPAPQPHRHKLFP